MIGLVIGITTASLLFAACAGSATPAGGVTDCRQEIRGVTGKIRPETSELGCTAISELIFGIPSEPEAYSIMGQSPRLLWNCRLYAANKLPVLLRCQHRKRHFTINKSSE
jgi:hypothetical protein